MLLRRVVVLASAGVLAAGVAVVATPTALAQPTPTPAPNAQSLAANAASDFLASRPAALHASASDAFTQHPVISFDGTQFVPYDRSYKGLPVVGGDFVVMTNSSGQVMDTSVAQDQTIDLASTTPKVTVKEAEATAGAALQSVTSATTPRLVVYAHGSPALAYESTVTGTGAEGSSKLSVVVDAQTGKVLETTEHVMHGTGTSAWNANPVTINTTHSGSTYTMRDPSITNLSCQNLSGNQVFSGPDDVWGNGNATDRETGCVDALFGSQTENRMIADWLGRNGPNGSGGAWPIRVGLNDLNAGYDGSQIQIGHNQAGGWIGAIDVIAHEQGHGIDDYTPGSISRGGTQEFVADTFGAASEWYANESTKDTPDFLVGEQINLTGNGPIRNMYNPSAVGHANCYSSSIPNTEVHAAAGPGNHWFYLLAEGTSPTNGQPTSPTCNSSSVTGVGIQNAIKIMYGAMLMKTSSSSYLKYRTWTLTAAKNLDATCGLFNTTKKAWDAVSVPAQSADPTCSASGGITVGNPGNRSGTVGTAITAFTVTASGGTSPYHFSATGLPPGVSINATSGQVSGTPTAGGTFAATVTVTDSSSPAKSGSVQFTFTVSGGGGGTCGQNLITNGTFESGTTGWTATSGVLTSGANAHAGTRFAWLDGYGRTHTDTLQQVLTVPAGCSATLSYYLWIDTEDEPSSAFDRLTLTANNQTLATFSNLDAGSGYVLRTASLAAFAGQSVTLKWTGTEDAGLATNFLIDDVSTS
ncbi:M4 family metallopeptidase [Actinophytocola oryzae]|uniref:Zn-dependent metalloprotease n=1 Tax=Actinophytocola oryzae TaxID=502181 RepID=A0A4R7W1H1_9PSEU|nr:M4 family metallopeptidase [Actinophytocola oryzae]TDV56410.1 Zn-dependent metalloprotease [Actinophytocola oryzae]